MGIVAQRSWVVALAGALFGCGGEGPSAPPSDRAFRLTVGPYVIARMPPTTSLRLEVKVFDRDGAQLETPPRSAFEWTSDDTTVARVTTDGVVTVPESAVPGVPTRIGVRYGEAQNGFAVISALPPIGARVEPEQTVTPGARITVFALAVTPRGLTEDSHIAAFTLDPTSTTVARLVKLGCQDQVADCPSVAPDAALLFTDAPGQAHVRAFVDGQIGVSTITIRNVGFATASAGETVTCGTTFDSLVFCWGDGYLDTPLQVERPGFTQVQVGGEQACGLDADRHPFCWSGRDLEPRSAGTVELAKLAAGAQSVCGLDDAGNAWCWGSNESGQLGDGTKTSTATAVAVVGGLTFTDIATSGDHTCALTPDGDAWCWGSNFFGELGEGPTGVCGLRSCSTVPVRAVAGHGFTQIVTGKNFSCGRNAIGSVDCWGNPDKLGSDATGPRGSPHSVAGGRIFIALSAGTDHACAVGQEGGAYCWGSNDVGQTGQPAVPGGFLREPTLVPGGHTFSSVDAGWGHACGIAVEGLVCWGYNGYGQLGARNVTGVGPVLVAGQGQAAP